MFGADPQLGLALIDLGHFPSNEGAPEVPRGRRLLRNQVGGNLTLSMNAGHSSSTSQHPTVVRPFGWFIDRSFHAFQTGGGKPAEMNKLGRPARSACPGHGRRILSRQALKSQIFLNGLLFAT